MKTAILLLCLTTSAFAGTGGGHSSGSFRTATVPRSHSSDASGESGPLDVRSSVARSEATTRAQATSEEAQTTLAQVPVDRVENGIVLETSGEFLWSVFKLVLAFSVLGLAFYFLYKLIKEFWL